jgi:hypothetical protein
MRRLSILAVVALAGCSGAWVGDDYRRIQLTGAEQVPPVQTQGWGTGRITVNDDGTVSGSVATTGVKGTMAHIHLGAKGQNGPVIIPLVKNGDNYAVPAGAKLNADQLKAFRENRLYVNVHSDMHKGGEVRAQIEQNDWFLR